MTFYPGLGDEEYELTYGRSPEEVEEHLAREDSEIAAFPTKSEHNDNRGMSPCVGDFVRSGLSGVSIHG